jgi:hypothetical protein
MVIKKRGSFQVEIFNVEDFENLIISEKIYKYFKKFSINHKHLIVDFIKNTEILNFKQIKPTLKRILNYPNTVYNKEFLICMGWEYNEIENFISDIQKYNSNKLSESKKKNPDLYKDKTTSNVEYWIKKGYSTDEAKIKVSERQSTFSLKKCIEKYGEKNGREIFNSRQKKWIETLKNKVNYLEIQKSKNPYKYDEKTYDLILKHSGFKDKINKIVNFCVKYKDVDDFAKCILEQDDIKKYSDFAPYISSKIIQNLYNVTPADLKNIIYSKIDLNQNRQYYGVSTYHNGIRYKSISEYRVGLFLEENCLNFKYEINYPNSNMKCDFYLPDYDMYIELFGLLDKKNLEKLDKTLEFYKIKMLEKIKFCEENKIKIIYDFNYNKLIEKIKKYYENQN